jgi:membrane protein required for beta-lactamase induction
MNYNFFLSASLFVIVLIGPITSVSLPLLPSWDINPVLEEILFYSLSPI